MSNAAVDFTQLLSKNVESAERPKPLPMGSYTFVIKSYACDRSQRKQTPFVRFLCAPMAPGADVDTAALPPNWREKELRLDYYVTDDAIYRLREFLEQCGLRVQGRTFGEVIPEAINCQFTGMVTHEAGTKNPGDVFANITSTAAA